MNVVFSVDLHRLESWLVDRVGANRDTRSIHPTLLVVPTARLAQHLKRRILEVHPAVLGLHVHTHYSFCQRVLEHALEPPPRRLPVSGERHLLERALSRMNANPPTSSGARRALLGTCRELREADLSADELTSSLPPSPQTRVLTEVYRLYEDELRGAIARGWSDYTGLVSAARPHVPTFLSRKNIQQAYHYGAYELVGVNVSLLETLDANSDLMFVLPSEIEPPAFRYARDFLDVARRRINTKITRVDHGNGSSANPWISRLAGLYHDESVSPKLLASQSSEQQLDWLAQQGPTLELRNTQGLEAELYAAALRALRLHTHDGVPWHEIAIIARTLQPYAPLLESTFNKVNIPWTTTQTHPLRQSSTVRSLLLLMRVYAFDFERGPLIELLRRNALQLQQDAPHPRDVDRWDDWSRRSRIARRLSAWRELPELLSALDANNEFRPNATDDHARDANRPSCERLMALLDELSGDVRVWQKASSLTDHIAFLKQLCDERLGERSSSLSDPAPTDPGIDSLLKCVETIDDVEQSSADASGRTYSTVEFLRLVEEIASEESLKLSGQEEAGVQVLDLMQARGLTHRVVQWIGFHDGVFPRKARSDPFLEDAQRSRLRKLTKKPIATKSSSGDEERLLLATTLAGASERICLSYARADDNGRQLARSSGMREIARAFTGRADVRLLLEDRTSNPYRPERVAAHVGERALLFSRSSRFGLLPPTDALAAVAIESDGSNSETQKTLNALGRVAMDSRTLARHATALDWVRRVEGFEPGRVGAEVDCLTEVGIHVDRAISVSAVEQLIRCPQSYFLRYVLGVRELIDAPEEHRIEIHALGTAVHDALKSVYGALKKKKKLKPPVEAAVAEALTLLGKEWDNVLRRSAGPSFERLRGLYRLLSARWLESLEQFVASDVRTLIENGVQNIELERNYRARIPLAANLAVEAYGRLDRVTLGNDGVFVTDYKTSGNLADKVASKNIVTGWNVQLPLYREILAQECRTTPQEIAAQLVGIGPEFDDPQGILAQLKWQPDVREGLLETIAVALRLVRDGRFPLQKSDGCRYCRYRRTCRKNHEPTLDRLNNESELRDFLALCEKSKKAPTLSKLREQDADNGAVTT